MPLSFRKFIAGTSKLFIYTLAICSSIDFAQSQSLYQSAPIDFVGVDVFEANDEIAIISVEVLFEEGCFSITNIREKRVEKTFLYAIEAAFPPNEYCDRISSPFGQSFELVLSSPYEGVYTIVINDKIEIIELYNRQVVVDPDRLSFDIEYTDPSTVTLAINWIQSCIHSHEKVFYQDRVGNDFLVTVLENVYPERSCSSAIVEVEETVSLNISTLQPGVYRVFVNGIEKTFTVPEQ